MKILIMRHGKPDLAAWAKIASRDLGSWIDAYTVSDVNGQSAPPEKAVQEARQCSLIVTSDLARSKGSARALQVGMIPIQSEKLFREAGWPFTAIPLLRLPPYTWAAIFRIFWFLGYRKNCPEPVDSVKQRAALAADRLISLARTHSCVLLVGHGIINTFIVRALLHRGWKGPRLPGYGYWAVSEYTKSDERFGRG